MMEELRPGMVRVGFVTHDRSSECPVDEALYVDLVFVEPHRQKRGVPASEVDWTNVFAYRESRRQH